MKEKNSDHDIIDKDLYEELDEEELYELVEKERQRAIAKSNKQHNHKPKRPFPKWAFWLIAIVMLFNVFAFFPKTFSIPAIEFLITSAKLSAKDSIQTYKKSVVVIEAGDRKGTGFSIAADGKVLTNYHVVKDEENVTVAYPDNGLYSGEVVEKYPAIDLAVLDVDETDLPFLQLAKNPQYNKDDAIYFIGNPLRFNGIANKGTIMEPITLHDWDKPVVMLNAPVYHGNSGSPVINKSGKVVGVIFATLDHDQFGKVGLFIPIDYYTRDRDL